MSCIELHAIAFDLFPPSRKSARDGENREMGVISTQTPTMLRALMGNMSPARRIQFRPSSSSNGEVRKRDFLAKYMFAHRDLIVRTQFTLI